MQNEMPTPYSHCHPYKAIGQPATHVGRCWQTLETEEEEGGAQYLLVLVLMKAL